MSRSVWSSPAQPGAAWDAALREVAGRPGLRDRLAHPASDLLLRFGESYARLTSLPRAQRRRLQRTLKLGLAGVALLLALGLTPSLALAGTINVNGTTCTLADAITTANTGTNTGGCTGGSAGTDTITLQADVNLTSVLPDITTTVVLEGGHYTIARTGGTNFRVLKVTTTGNLTLHNATISGGRAHTGLETTGGGISNQGTLTVQNCTLSSNYAESGGGGIFNSGQLTVQSSILSGNTSGGSGGGISNSGQATVQTSTLSGNSGYAGGGIASTNTLTVQQSTLSGNSAVYGGGISARAVVTIESSTLSGNSAISGGGGGIDVNPLGKVTVRNSTLSGNSANSYGGGGILTYGTVTIQNSTLTGNSAGGGGGGGIKIGGNNTVHGTVTVKNSIVAQQTVGGDCVNNGTLTSQGYNIESGTSCGFTGTGDQRNVTSAQLKLCSLADNSGPTKTHGIAPGSVAIDQIPAASCLGLTTDQRGSTRPVDYNEFGVAKCDVGAFELQIDEIPNAVALRELRASGVSPGGGLPGLAALLSGLGGLAAWRRRAARRGQVGPPAE